MTGAFIAQLRRQFGVSQAVLAAACGVDSSTIAKLEADRHRGVQNPLAAVVRQFRATLEADRLLAKSNQDALAATHREHLRERVIATGAYPWTSAASSIAEHVKYCSVCLAALVLAGQVAAENKDFRDWREAKEAQQ